MSDRKTARRTAKKRETHAHSFLPAAGIEVTSARRPRNKEELQTLPVVWVHEADGTVTELVVDRPSDDAVLVELPPLMANDEETVEMDATRVWMTPAQYAEHMAFEQSRLAAVEMVEKLKAGITDFERWATEPPMTWLRLMHITLELMRLSRIEQRNLSRAIEKQRREQAREAAAAPRPNARGKSKWPTEVHTCAKACYDEWIAAAEGASELWGAKWEAFAKLCVKRIKKETLWDVEPESLRKSILPAENFPRPR